LYKTEHICKNEANSIIAPEMFNLNDVWQIFLVKIAELSYQESLRVIDQIIESLSPNVHKKNV
jgi:hypothetical protein